jgi:hypothetical protein
MYCLIVDRRRGGRELSGSKSIFRRRRRRRIFMDQGIVF